MIRSIGAVIIGCGLAFSYPGQTNAADTAATRPPTLLPSGSFSTVRSQIVDQQGRPVRLACVGLNEPNFSVSMTRQLQIVVASGFNCLRMSWVDAKMQEDLVTIDRVAAAAGPLGLRLILDHHGNEAGTPADGYGAQQKNGLWFDSGPGSDGTNGAGVKGTVTDARWIANWVDVARRYAGNPTVIGFDLDNEPFETPGGATWGGGGPKDIQAAYTRAGNAIQAVNPDALIICEGPILWAPLYGEDLNSCQTLSGHPWRGEQGCLQRTLVSQRHRRRTKRSRGALHKDLERCVRLPDHPGHRAGVGWRDGRVPGRRRGKRKARRRGRRTSLGRDTGRLSQWAGTGRASHSGGWRGGRH